MKVGNERERSSAFGVHETPRSGGVCQAVAEVNVHSHFTSPFGLARNLLARPRQHNINQLSVSPPSHLQLPNRYRNTTYRQVHHQSLQNLNCNPSKTATDDPIVPLHNLNQNGRHPPGNPNRADNHPPPTSRRIHGRRLRRRPPRQYLLDTAGLHPRPHPRLLPRVRVL